MYIDPAFEKFFNQKIKQILICITDDCNLHCEHCYYKTTLAPREIELDTAINLLHIFKNYGAEKITIIGGEPTLYGVYQAHEPLFKVIEAAKQLGYSYVRCDTNGQLSTDKFLEDPRFKMLDNFSFSLEGHTASLNDKIRGIGTFDKSIVMLKKAVDLGYYVSVTVCINIYNIIYTDAMISFFESLGVKELNFHPMFKMGVIRDNFTGNVHIEPEDWMKEYERLRKNIDDNKYPIDLRIPRRFVTRQEYEKSPPSYEYCPVRMGERVWIQPDGHMRVCALCFGSPYHIATYNKEQIKFATQNNELMEERLKRHPCMSQTRNYGDLVPLCISYKPFQNEFLWTTLELDEKYGLTTQYF